jgi:hypothetical protein
MDRMAERDIEVPASAFTAPTPVGRAVVPHRERRQMRVPDPAELADRERLR